MPSKAKAVIKWIDKELPPLSWSVISIQLMKTLVNNGVSPRNIDDATMFNDEIINDIKALIKKTYNKEMPTL